MHLKAAALVALCAAAGATPVPYNTEQNYGSSLTAVDEAGWKNGQRDSHIAERAPGSLSEADEAKTKNFMNKLFDMWIPDAKNRDSALDAVMTKVENGNAKNEKRDLGAQEQQQGQQGQQDQQGQQNEQKQNQQEGQQKSWWQSFREKLSGAQQKNENQEHQESNQQQQNDQQQQNGQQHQNDQQQQINQQNQNQHSAQLHERIAPQVEDFSSNKETSHEHLHERSQMNPQFESNHDETNKQDDADCDKGKEMQMQADGQMQPRSEQGDMERVNSENSEIQEQKDGRQEAEGKQRDEREQKEQREENQLQERAQGRQDMREGEMEGLEMNHTEGQN